MPPQTILDATHLQSKKIKDWFKGGARRFRFTCPLCCKRVGLYKGVRRNGRNRATRVRKHEGIDGKPCPLSWKLLSGHVPTASGHPVRYVDILPSAETVAMNANDGIILCHNHIRLFVAPLGASDAVVSEEEWATGRFARNHELAGSSIIGANGFRCWWAPKGRKYVKCDCGFAMHLGPHYKVRGTW